MKITIAQSALSDLQEIKAYYMAQGAPDIGQKFVNVILKSVQNLRDHPDSGRKVPEFNQDRIREIIYPPFRVVYLRNTASVSLVRVWRSERLLLLPDDETWPHAKLLVLSMEANNHENWIRSLQDEVAQESLRVNAQDTCHHAPLRRRCCLLQTHAADAGVPYQSLINLYLRDCVTQHRQVKIDWPSKAWHAFHRNKREAAQNGFTHKKRGLAASFLFPQLPND